MDTMRYEGSKTVFFLQHCDDFRVLISWVTNDKDDETRTYQDMVLQNEEYRYVYWPKQEYTWLKPGWIVNRIERKRAILFCSPGGSYSTTEQKRCRVL